MDPVKFWRTHSEGKRITWGEFSNFAKFPFTVDGVKYATSEHYFQCMKYPPGEHRDAVLEAVKPGEAAAVGRDRSRPLRSDWEKVKDDVMYEALQHKFAAYPDLVKLLLSTGDREIIEDSPIDLSLIHISEPTRPY